MVKVGGTQSKESNITYWRMNGRWTPKSETNDDKTASRYINIILFYKVLTNFSNLEARAIYGQFKSSNALSYSAVLLYFKDQTKGLHVMSAVEKWRHHYGQKGLPPLCLSRFSRTDRSRSSSSRRKSRLRTSSTVPWPSCLK